MDDELSVECQNCSKHWHLFFWSKRLKYTDGIATRDARTVTFVPYIHKWRKVQWRLQVIVRNNILQKRTTTLKTQNRAVRVIEQEKSCLIVFIELFKILKERQPISIRIDPSL